VQSDGLVQADGRRENEAAMKPPKDSRMADEKAAVDLQRKQPSWL
jgi:hypothetical protein